MDRRQQETRELAGDRYKIACAAFAADQISIDVFRATLHQLGFRGQAIETEVSLAWPFRTIGQAAQQTLMSCDDARHFVTGLE